MSGSPLCTSDGTCIHIKELMNLIKKGEEKDVLQFLDSRNLTGEHFIERKPYFLLDPEHAYWAGFVSTAASLGHVKVLNALISRGFDPSELHSGSGFESQPIHEVCKTGHLSIFKALVEDHKVPIDTTSSEIGQTALYIVLSESHPFVHPIAEFLLKAGASVNYRVGMEGSFRVPLLECVSNPHATPELLQLLLSHGADVNDSGGHPPLHRVAENGRLDFLKILLDAGANTEITDDIDGQPYRHSDHHRISRRRSFDTAFIRATKYKQLPALKLLYSHGANPEYSNMLGNTALHEAAALGLYDIARYLIVDIGVALDKKNDKKETPLLRALGESQTRIVHLIHKAGYNPRQEEIELGDNNPILEKEGVSELLQELQQLASTPRSLQDFCIFKIRFTLGKIFPHALDSILLPNKLKDLITLNHL